MSWSRMAFVGLPRGLGRLMSPAATPMHQSAMFRGGADGPPRSFGWRNRRAYSTSMSYHHADVSDVRRARRGGECSDQHPGDREYRRIGHRQERTQDQDRLGALSRRRPPTLVRRFPRPRRRRHDREAEQRHEPMSQPTQIPQPASSAVHAPVNGMYLQHGFSRDVGRVRRKTRLKPALNLVHEPALPTCLDRPGNPPTLP